MAEKQPNPRAKELVLEKCPSAYATGNEYLYCIWPEKTFITLTENCHHCGQPWTRTVESLGEEIGSAGTEGWAWHNAAVNLKLIPW